MPQKRITVEIFDFLKKTIIVADEIKK